MKLLRAFYIMQTKKEATKAFSQDSLSSRESKPLSCAARGRRKWGQWASKVVYAFRLAYLGFRAAALGNQLLADPVSVLHQTVLSAGSALGSETIL
jgi:hypothetical protein